MNALSNLILTGAAIAPVLVVYGVVAAVECKSIAAVILFLVAALLFLLGIGLLRFLRKRLERLSFSFSTVEAADRESIGLLVLYLLPLLRTSFSGLDIIILIPAAAIFAALALTGHSFHFNPLLNLAGWHFYKVNTPEGVTYALVTRKSLTRAAENITVGQLTAYTLIDLEP